MKKSGSNAKGISELKAIAEKAGIIAKKTWKKEDFIKAISDKASSQKKPKKQAVKAVRPKAPVKKAAKKTGPAKKAVQKRIKPRSGEKNPAEPAVKPKKKPVAKPKGPATKKQPAKKAPVAPKGAAAVKAVTGTAGKRPVKAAGTKPERAATVITAAKKALEKTGTFTGKPSGAKKNRRVKNHDAEGPAPMPGGHGESKVVSMSVTPRRIYVYWEIAGPAISNQKGSLNLKIVASSPAASFYLPISERIGEHFINVAPDKRYTIEIGAIDLKGEFQKISQSQPVTTPAATIQPMAVPCVPAPSALGELSGLSSQGVPSGAEGPARLPDEFFDMPDSVSQY